MHVIVTGGSSGIGLAVAKAYAARGERVSLIARDAARLDQAVRDVQAVSKGGSSFAVSADVSKHEDLAFAVKACETANGPCDVLIASAGIVEPAAFDAISAAAFDQQITTNLLGTANAARAVYHSMKARGQGTIMVVSSGAALIGLHGYAAYCASKSALKGFAEAVQAEAVGTGIRVSICFPPDTLTPQYQREMTMRPWQAEVLMGKVKPWTAEAIAQRIIAGIDRNRSKIHFTLSLMALAYLGPFIKPLLSRWYRYRLKRGARETHATPSTVHLKTGISSGIDTPKL
ncbi:SDR family NAD(P)-dependent oxidoreductase [Rhizobium sp. 007]|uniref:SDR family NAD(P)-dependent oxidoreductase n=1 Tax=Rhizobium sp. 007 TaxID=2785056 RepID=UPI00188EAD5B|nr:SDR family NAD(P)-dependent oxidoreductase [Rhizobium sp. 007]QPB18719.1 SDR family NAD(P)-dependent oxidoreductase [Rhizobium sp. 007]